MLTSTLKKLGKTKINLITTNMKITNFIRKVMATIGVLVVDIMVGSKTSNSTFFVVNAKPMYSILLE